MLLASLTDPEAIRYRQHVLADCLAEPDTSGGCMPSPSARSRTSGRLWGFGVAVPAAILSGAVSQLEVLIVRLRELRQVADEPRGPLLLRRADDAACQLQHELDDDYFETLSRAPAAAAIPQRRADQRRTRPGQQRHRLRPPRPAAHGGAGRSASGSTPRTGVLLHHPARDEAGARALEEMTSRGINLVANAAAQSADHISSFFTMLRAELGFYVGCLNLHDQLAAAGSRWLSRAVGLGPPALSARTCATSAWRCGSDARRRQ